MSRNNAAPHPGFLPAVPAADEQERLQALHAYNLLNTAPEERFDAITAHLALRLNTDYALLSLVDKERQWFKSAYGLDAKETPRSHAICAHAIGGEGVFVVCDTSKDKRFSGNPLVTGAPYIRFYAGMPLITAGGYAIGTLCVADTRPRERLEPEDEALLRVLASSAADAIELRAVRAKPEREHRERASFIACMSHEIRTPLNGVIGAANLLAHGETDRNKLQYINAIRRSGEALSGIINNVLDYSKMEAGKHTSRVREHDIRVCVSEIAESLKPCADARSVSLTLLFFPSLPAAVMTDIVVIRSIVSNFMSNAIKCTREGHVVLSVEAKEAGEQDGIDVTISCLDTGKGFSPADTERIFGMYEQTEDAAQGGSGLGLAICMKMAKTVNGTISACGEPGRGALFTAKLPAGALPSAVTPAPPPEIAQPVALIGGERLMRPFARYLEACGGEISQYSTYEEALADAFFLRTSAAVADRYSAALPDNAEDGGHMLVLDGHSEQIYTGADIFEAVKGNRSYTENPQHEDDGKKKILLVDDNAVNRLIVGKMLENIGYDVDTAENGLIAEEKALKHSYYAVLMDCMMPVKNGYEAASAIRAQEAGRRNIIIAFTAVTGHEEREKCFEAGMDDFLSKPVKEAALKEALEKYDAPSSYVI